MTHTRLEELAQRLAARTQELRGERTPAPALRVALIKRGNDWLVSDVLPINAR